jgi:NTE family protein
VAEADLVLEGGGVKGLGLVGAVTRLMEAGYTFERIAGTSVGSIVGALVAGGAGVKEIPAIMARLEFERVSDRGRIGLPLVAETFNLLFERGAYAGDYIHGWLRDELADLGVTTFASLRRTDPGDDKNRSRELRHKLVVMVSDVTRGRLLRLPWDYELIGLEADEQLVADAVRASMSIPLYFEPPTLRDAKTREDLTLVDGGLLSNFPIEAFDRTDGEPPRWPTFGVKVIPSLPNDARQLFPVLGLPALPAVRLLQQVVATAIVGHDQTHLERPCVRRRTMEVDTRSVGIVEFDVDDARRKGLIRNGGRAAEGFLERWDWEAYKADCRDR